VVTLGSGCRQTGETVVTERFALVLKTNCIRQPKRKLPSSSYNHKTLTTLRASVRESPAFTKRWKFLIAILKCIYTVFLTESCQCIVVVR